jgi:hypothetical protein
MHSKPTEVALLEKLGPGGQKGGKATSYKDAGLLK